MPEPTGRNIPVIRKINLEMSLLISRSVVRDLRTYFDSWTSIRQRAKPVRHPIPSEERWAGQISTSEILEGGLKLKALLESVPLQCLRCFRSSALESFCGVIYLCYKLARELNLGLTFFEGLDRIGHQLAAETSNFSPSSNFSTDDVEQMTQFRQKCRIKHMRTNYSGCRIANLMFDFKVFFFFWQSERSSLYNTLQKTWTHFPAHIFEKL